MIDRKGIFWFLAITFGLTWVIQIAAFSTGFTIMGLTSNLGTLVALPFMFMPALGAFITAKFITREGFAGMGLRLGPWKEYLRIGLLFPALFILVYAITWLLGFGAPDWNLEYFKGLFTASNMPAPEMPDTRLVLAAVFFSTLTVGTIFNWVFCAGEEIGWRGYLLPKLMPLGKTRAYLLLGLIWSIWHWPLVWMGFTYYQPGSLLALLAFTALTTGLGIFLNELTLRTKSSLLAGWAHGVFNTQKLGMWFLLFPRVSPFLGGYAGLVGLLTWTALGFWEMRRKH
jgi:uncharacterized protein